MHVLQTQTGLFYTGKAGEGWVSPERADAFGYSAFTEACRVQEVFNKRSALTGLLFQIEPE